MSPNEPSVLARAPNKATSDDVFAALHALEAAVARLETLVAHTDEPAAPDQSIAAA